MKISVKFVIRTLIIFITVLTVLFVGSDFFMRLKGKEMASRKLSTLLKRSVKIGDIRVLYPLGLRIKDLHIEGYGYAKEVTVGLGIIHLFDNNLAFSTLIFNEPQCVLHRTKDNAIVFGDLPVEKSIVQEGSLLPVTEGGPDKKPTGKKPGESKRFNFTVDKLIVKNGAVSFFDHSSEENVLQVVVRRINLSARHISLVPKAAKTKFDLTAVMGHPGTEAECGKMESHGWLNLAKKDMKGELKIENLDGRIFSSFYGSAMKTNFKNIVADLFVEAESKNNDMTVKGRLKVKDFAFDIKKEDSDSIEDIILGGLQSMAKGMALEFSFKTKMDDFKMESVSFTGNIFSGIFESNKETSLAGIY